MSDRSDKSDGSDKSDLSERRVTVGVGMRDYYAGIGCKGKYFREIINGGNQFAGFCC